jgi:hypothetical protein
MSRDDDIPVLTDLIRDGNQPATPGPDVELIADDGLDQEDLTIDLATHESFEQDLSQPAPPTLPDALDEQGELDNLEELTEDTSLKELIVDEEIRLILDKHMEAAYEEILKLLRHKIR